MSYLPTDPAKLTADQIARIEDALKEQAMQNPFAQLLVSVLARRPEQKDKAETITQAYARMWQIMLSMNQAVSPQTPLGKAKRMLRKLVEGDRIGAQ